MRIAMLQTPVGSISPEYSCSSSACSVIALKRFLLPAGCLHHFGLMLQQKSVAGNSFSTAALPLKSWLSLL